jgi:hypothetical protein
MDRKWFAYARAALLVLVLSVMSATLPAYAHDPQGPPNPAFVPDDSLLDPIAGLAELPDSMPDPVLTSGVAPSDDRDNSTPTAWQIRAHQTPLQVTETINAGFRLVDMVPPLLSMGITQQQILAFREGARR